MEDQDLLRDELDRAQPHVLPAAGHVAQVLERGEVVTHLPDEVGGGDEQRDGGAHPRPGRAQVLPIRGRAAGPRPADTREEHRGVLVHQAESRQGPEDEPQPRVAAPHDPDQGPHAAHPEQGLEGVHGEDAVGAQVDGRREHGQAGHALREAPASQLPGQDHGEGHEQRPGQGGDEAQDVERAAEEQGQPGHEADHRGVIDVAPVQVPAAIQEVELVAEVAVAAGESSVDRELQSGERDEQPPIETGDRRRRHLGGHGRTLRVSAAHGKVGVDAGSAGRRVATRTSCDSTH